MKRPRAEGAQTDEGAIEQSPQRSRIELPNEAIGQVALMPMRSLGTSMLRSTQKPAEWNWMDNVTAIFGSSNSNSNSTTTSDNGSNNTAPAVHFLIPAHAAAIAGSMAPISTTTPEALSSPTWAQPIQPQRTPQAGAFMPGVQASVPHPIQLAASVPTLPPPDNSALYDDLIDVFDWN